MIKILYFDTSAIIKYFVNEKGSKLIKWIVNNHVLHSLRLETSQIALHEFSNSLKKKVKRGEISEEQMIKIIRKSKHYLPNVFHIGDFRPVPHYKSSNDTTYLELCKKYGLKIEKNGWDARHLAYVVNYLRIYSGVSRPRFITADIKFGKIIKSEGYEFINPEKVSIADFLSLIEK